MEKGVVTVKNTNCENLAMRFGQRASAELVLVREDGGGREVGAPTTRENLKGFPPCPLRNMRKEPSS